MHASLQEKQVFGDVVQVIARQTDCTIYRINDPSGEMTMTCYPVFSGIDLVYVDAHINSCSVRYALPANVIEIAHCQQGRIECETNHAFFYLSPGDLVVRHKSNAVHDFHFPLSHYHGMLILIDVDHAPRCLSCLLEDVTVQPAALQQKFCQGDRPFVARSKPCLAHIFSELYAVPESIRKGYFKVKILELLLFLSSLEINLDETAQRCLPSAQVALAKAVCAHLSAHMDSRITIATLADVFHVSQTALKSCFKSVYGISVYSYIRTQKMQSAALQLRQSTRSVLEIAGMHGYDNASKFASAFRAVMGVSPNEYRIQPPE